MKTAIQGGHTVLSWIVEIHKSFLIAFVFVGELLSGIIGVIFFDWFDYYFVHRCFNNCNKVYLYVYKISIGEEESECMRILGGSRDRGVQDPP